jgi:four helix bundle protein
MELVELTYDASRRFPEGERFGLTSQSQRAAVSVPANIAEGYGRGSDGEFQRFLSISFGSLCELETLLELANRLGYLDEESISSLRNKASEVGRLIVALRRKTTAQRNQ